MKKHLFIFSILFLCLNCSKDKSSMVLSYTEDELMEFRNIAWNDLSTQEQETVLNSWEESVIHSCKVVREDQTWYYIFKDDKGNNHKSTMVITNPSLNFQNDQSFISVFFITSDNALLCPIVVIIEPNKNKVFGRDTRT